MTSFRGLPPDDVELVKNMTLSGIPTRQILCSLRQKNENLSAISRTIYNLKTKIRKDNLGNRPMISVLFEEFEKDGFSYDILHDREGHITRLFNARPLSIKLAKAFSNTFVMDCTYKTNQYNMPLLDIIGVSCFNTSFYAVFVFLERVDEENYIWALSAFKEILGNDNQPSVIMSDRELALMNGINHVFPTATSLLCVWHIEKNVLINCKKYFGRAEEFDTFMSSWKNVVYSTTETLFEINWGEFELFYREKKDAVDYIKNIWLPWKEKFISAWTEKYFHFGNRSSSRAEGAHAKLKMYLQVSTCCLKEAKDKICLAIKQEYNEIKVKLASERIQVPHDCNKPVFRELLYRVSQFALKEIYNQYKTIKDGTMTPCTGHFMATMGLPCAHKIRDQHGMTLSMDLIHPQWRIDTLSLITNDEDSQDDRNKKFVKLIDELSSKYQVWPLSKKEFAISVLDKLVNDSCPLFEPIIQQPKGRPPNSTKKRGTTSTKRDPSRFEIVESLRKSNEVNKENSFMRHENNVIDLNTFPDF